MNRYGEQNVHPLLATRQAASDQGAYYTATAATPGSGQGIGVLAAFAATTPAAVIQNNDTAAGYARTVQLDYWRAVVSVIPASTTISRWAVIVDTGARTPSGGFTLLTPNPTITGGGGSAAKGKVWVPNAAIITAPAAVTPKTIGTGAFGGLPILGDELVIQFGTGRSSNPTSATAGSKISYCPPVTLEAGHFALIYVWFVSNAVTGATLETDVGFIER